MSQLSQTKEREKGIVENNDCSIVRGQVSVKVGLNDEVTGLLQGEEVVLDGAL